MSNPKTVKVAAIEPEFCVATDKYELMLLLAMFPNECKFVGISIEHGRYMQALFTYHQVAESALRNWHKMTESIFEDAPMLETYFHFLAQCLLEGEARKLFEYWTRGRNYSGYSKDYAFDESIVASSHQAAKIASEKDNVDEN